MTAFADLTPADVDAIRQHLAFREARDCCRECHLEWIHEHSGLPPAVVAWVMGPEDPYDWLTGPGAELVDAPPIDPHDAATDGTGDDLQDGPT